ncbi:MAG: DUF2062 domain-containing protein [Candidatus Omnitrophota bacterium]|nr:DUF2062 domain-containing protein [Candidatus Omnitrophota bacterium]
MVKHFFKDINQRLVKINDSNQRIALGAGLGVFLGIIPGAGPIISLILASILRINKAAALLGCLLTNTWISFVSAVLAVKIGAFIFQIDWQILWQNSKNAIENFKPLVFLNLAILKILAPIAVGYLVIGVFSGFSAYLISLLIIYGYRKNK